MAEETKFAIVHTTDFPWEAFRELLPDELIARVKVGVYSNHANALAGIASLRALEFDRVVYVCNTYWTGEGSNTEWLEEVQEILELNPSNTRVRIVPFEPDFESVMHTLAEQIENSGDKGVQSLLGEMTEEERDEMKSTPPAVEKSRKGIRRLFRPAEAWKTGAGKESGEYRYSKQAREALSGAGQVRDVISFFES